jgi:hypothetical protein
MLNGLARRYAKRYSNSYALFHSVSLATTVNYTKEKGVETGQFGLNPIPCLCMKNICGRLARKPICRLLVVGHRGVPIFRNKDQVVVDYQRNRDRS